MDLNLKQTLILLFLVFAIIAGFVLALLFNTLGPFFFACIVLPIIFYPVMQHFENK